MWPTLQVNPVSVDDYPSSYINAIKAGGYDAAIIAGPDWSSAKADGSACGLQTIGTTLHTAFLWSVNPIV